VAAVPETGSQGEYSRGFAVAVMAAYGTITLDHISGGGLCDPTVARLVGRTRATEDDRHEARFPAGRWADVTVSLTDGRVLLSGDTHARGGPERPFDRQDICDKFQHFSEPVLGHARTAAIQDAALSLTEPTARFADLSQHLFAAP